MGALDCYIAGKPGFGLASDVLALLKPEFIADHCRELLFADTEEESVPGQRTMADAILPDLADGRALEWLPDLFAHDDPLIVGTCIRVISKLLFGGWMEFEDAEPYLRSAADHEDRQVRAAAGQAIGHHSNSPPLRAEPSQDRLGQNLCITLADGTADPRIGDVIRIIFPDKTISELTVVDVGDETLEANCEGIDCQLERSGDRKYFIRFSEFAADGFQDDEVLKLYQYHRAERE